MKEASGEASMTVITIVLIGIVAAIAIPLVTNMMNNASEQGDCQAKGCYWDSASESCKNGNGAAC